MNPESYPRQWTPEYGQLVLSVLNCGKCESCEQRPWVFCLIVDGTPFAVCEDCA